MEFTLFNELYNEALEIDDFVYKAYGAIEGVSRDELTRIHRLANNALRDNRMPNRAEFCRLYGIPERTVVAWELGQNKIAPYVKKLIDYSIFMTR